MSKTINKAKEEIETKETYEVLSLSTLIDLLDNWEFEPLDEKVIKDIIKSRWPFCEMM